MRIAHECHAPCMAQRQHDMLVLSRGRNKIEQVFGDELAYFRYRNQLSRNQADPRDFMNVQKRLAYIEPVQILFLADHQQADPATGTDRILRGLQSGTLKQRNAECLQRFCVRADALGTAGRTQDQCDLILFRSLGGE